MRAPRNALLCLAAIAALLVSLDSALAQKLNRAGPAAPSRGGGGYQGGDGGSFRGGGWGGTIPGVLMAIPQVVPQGGQVIDDGADDPQGPRRQTSPRRTSSGIPPANERRYVPDEVVIELPNTISAQALDAFQRRSRLVQVERQTSQLTGTTLYRWRIPDRRSVPTMVRQLETDTVVVSAQPNYLVRLQQAESKAEGDPAQYELAKLHLPQAHALAKGDNILIAVIDSGIDASHPDLAGAVAQTFDALDTPMAPHKHGTAIAGLIAAHGKLMGSAPGARILAIRAFDPAGASAEGSTFGILKSLDWAAANAGAKSPPLYPAADANVIAVTATDADDKLFEPSNRGSHIAIAAPGAQIMVAIPDGGYEVSSGTSYSAAAVSGIVALMLD